MSNQFSNNNNSSNNNKSNSQFTPGQLRLKDKQREQIAFNKVLTQSTNLVQFLNEFADTYDTLGGGSEGKFSSYSLNKALHEMEEFN